MSRTVWTGRRHRRAAVIVAATLAVSTVAALGPTPVTVVANAASPSSSAAVAGALVAAASASTSDAASVVPDRRPVAIAPRTAVKVPARVGTVAPYRFATKAYNQWWAKLLMARAHGWSAPSQFRCLVNLWDHESHWNYRAHNNGSGAHGIPQALPGSKMRTAGADWRTNPVTQIKWGLGYIDSRYGSPCGAWGHFTQHGWY